jgi:hypothetical protein
MNSFDILLRGVKITLFNLIPLLVISGPGLGFKLSYAISPHFENAEGDLARSLLYLGKDLSWSV